MKFLAKAKIGESKKVLTVTGDGDGFDDDSRNSDKVKD
jgi:hypothetical protein